MSHGQAKIYNPFNHPLMFINKGELFVSDQVTHHDTGTATGQQAQSRRGMFSSPQFSLSENSLSTEVKKKAELGGGKQLCIPVSSKYILIFFPKF